jgi:uncharacterized membrane protein YfcA
MIDLTLPLLAFAFAVFVAAGLVKGVTGMGLPTVAMGLLATTMPPHESAALLLVPSLVTNVWQLAAGPSPRAAAKRFWPMMAGVTGGAVATAGVLAGDATHYATIGLGVVLMVYALFGLSGRRLRAPPSSERTLAIPVGLATGLITGATGVFAMPAVLYLQALGLEKEELIQALGLSFTVSTLALAAGLGFAGALDPHTLGGSALALVPAGLGMAAGQRLRRRISPTAFKFAFFVGLLGLGAYLVVTSMG